MRVFARKALTLLAGPIVIERKPYAYALPDLFDHHTYPYSPSHMCIYISRSTPVVEHWLSKPSRAVASPRHQSTGGALHYLPIVQLPEA